MKTKSLKQYYLPPHRFVKNTNYNSHINENVAADAVLTVKPNRERYYPDNEGIPSITFWFGGENYHHWYFDKGNEELRDKTLNKILHGP